MTEGETMMAKVSADLDAMDTSDPDCDKKLEKSQKDMYAAFRVMRDEALRPRTTYKQLMEGARMVWDFAEDGVVELNHNGRRTTVTRKELHYYELFGEPLRVAKSTTDTKMPWRRIACFSLAASFVVYVTLLTMENPISWVFLAIYVVLYIGMLSYLFIETRKLALFLKHLS